MEFKTKTNNMIYSDKIKYQFITNGLTMYEVVDQVEKVCQGGGRWIQLRMKDCCDADIVNTGKQVNEICSQYGATMVMNDHVHLVEEVGFHGVHLGHNDMSVVKARELLGDKMIIGGTANSYLDMENLIKQGVDYIGLGPFRFTTTKKNLSSVLGLEGYTSRMKRLLLLDNNVPVVAIGGIIRGDIKAIMECGVDGIAVSSSVIKSDNMAQEVQKQLIKVTRVTKSKSLEKLRLIDDQYTQNQKTINQEREI